LSIPPRFISQGIAQARLPCRFEIIRQIPLVVLDGAHNYIKMQGTLDNLKHLSYKKLWLVIALAANKDITKILKVIVPAADHILATRFEIIQRKCLNPAEIAQLATQYKKPAVKIEIYLSPQQALKQALKLACHKDLILVTGSFFLAGQLRKFWYPEEYILKNLRSF
jgi:dihydrofolate synthase/folylpolyglutamate synthase